MANRLLRKKDDGYIYPWTPALAARGDMEEVSPSGEADSNKTEVSEPDTALAVLREQAKALGVKRYWLMGAERLTEEIRRATAGTA